jgi:drug/metabolite transporter (DMT)-like permease
LFALIGSFTYLATLVLKIEALKVLDSTIFFPLYKVVGPLLVLVIGIGFFAESFSTLQWVGLGLSFCIPLLLISRSENGRQQNLKKGLLYVLFAACIGSISIALFKYGIDLSINPWLFLLVSDVFLAGASILVLMKRHRSQTIVHARQIMVPKAISLVAVMGIAQMLSASTFIFSFVAGGTLGIVYVINSLYVVVPIALSILIYHEHWNVRKLCAILLSIVALALLR